MRRAWLAAVVLVVVGLTGPARAERDLRQAVELAIQEATNVEEDIGAGLLRGTRLAKHLRRGKSSLRQALEKHDAQAWKGASLKLAKGLASLLKAFPEHEPSGPGLDALRGILEEVDQHVADALPDLRTRADELPESRTLTRANRHLGEASDLLSDYRREPTTITGVALLIAAYEQVGKAGKKIGRLERAGKTDVAGLGKLVPGKLPKAQYSIRWWLNGDLINAGYRTNVHPPKVTKQVIRNWIQNYLENRVDGRDCTEDVTGTAFDGARFSIDARLDCSGEVTTVRFVITKLVE